MCTIHTLYTYTTTIEIVDIDDDLDFAMDMGRKSRWILPLNSIYQHVKWKVWEGRPCMVVQKAHASQLATQHMIYSKYCHHMSSTIVTSWTDVRYDFRFVWFTCLEQHLYIFSPLYQITHTFVLRHSDIDHLVNTGIFSWQWIYLMGLNCIHHYEERWI